MVDERRGYLCQRWVHSHEEDTESETVYRPAGFAFPPARGRTGFELLADKSCRDLGIAAADGTTVTEGSWDIEEEGDLKLRIIIRGSSRVLNIAFVDRHRLVIRKDTE